MMKEIQFLSFEIRHSLFAIRYSLSCTLPSLLSYA
jgi:hypothetical protein